MLRVQKSVREIVNKYIDLIRTKIDHQDVLRKINEDIDIEIYCDKKLKKKIDIEIVIKDDQYLIRLYLHPSLIFFDKEQQKEKFENYFNIVNNIPVVFEEGSEERSEPLGKAHVYAFPIYSYHNLTYDILNQLVEANGVEIETHTVPLFECYSDELFNNDFVLDDLDIEALVEANPNIILFSPTDNDIPFLKSLIKQIRKILPKTYIMIGGASVSKFPEHMAALLEVDIVYRGEAECNNDFAEIIKMIGDSKRSQPFTKEQIEAFKKIKGLLIRSNDTLICNSLNHVNLANTDELLFVTPTQFQTEVRTSLGCPWGKCNFCDRSVTTKFRVVGENNKKENITGAKAFVDWLKRKHELGDTIINISDSDFLVRKDFPEIKRLLEEKDLDKYFSFTFQCSPMHLVNKNGEFKKDLALLLKSIGVMAINLGIDGIQNEDMIHLNKKNQCLDKILKIIDELNQIGIEVLINVILTNPYTTVSDVVKSILIMNAVEIDINCSSIYTWIYFGSIFYHNLLIQDARFLEYVENEKELKDIYLEKGWIFPKAQEYCFLTPKITIPQDDKIDTNILNKLKQKEISYNDFLKHYIDVIPSVLSNWNIEGPYEKNLFNRVIEVSNCLILSMSEEKQAEFYNKLSDAIKDRFPGIKTKDSTSLACA